MTPLTQTTPLGLHSSRRKLYGRLSYTKAEHTFPRHRILLLQLAQLLTKWAPLNKTNSPTRFLQGTFDIDLLTNLIEIRDIVKGMSYQDPSNPPEFDCTITVAQLKAQFKSAKESTASSPNGLDYGHWKTLVRDDDIFFPFASMISFAFKWGVPPKAWETAVQPVLEKDQGSPKITRL